MNRKVLDKSIVFMEVPDVENPVFGLSSMAFNPQTGYSIRSTSDIGLLPRDEAGIF